jgi:hypothetical protein
VREPIGWKFYYSCGYIFCIVIARGWVGNGGCFEDLGFKSIYLMGSKRGARYMKRISDDFKG